MQHNKPIGRKRMITAKRVLLSLLLLLVVLLVWIKMRITVDPPIPVSEKALECNVVKVDSTLYSCNGSWMRKSSSGLWELYTQGDPFTRGMSIGKLSQQLVIEQEKAFVGEIREIIPSTFFINFLRFFIAWFNRDLDTYVDKEFLLEIYGISLSASDEFNFIGDKFQRILNYHAAHDIGHALVEQKMVGCSSFAVWDEFSDDSSLIIGRNFDFYIGDAFAENKIICFYHPDSGYNFMMVSWGGMTGVVSGMNDQGLTISLNAARSEIPSGAATPISILAREILQYSKNIDEAYAIAKKRKTFVSESILIGSSKDHKAVIIEKTPSKCVLYSQSMHRIICTNHFQSDVFQYDSMNIQQMRESASMYRYHRMEELMQRFGTFSVQDAAALLRDRGGLNDSNIGMGNEKSVNQLIAHHSIIFKPEKRQVWVSTAPYQLGKYVAYDLKKVFSKYATLQKDSEIYEPQLAIAADTFLLSESYADYVRFRKLKKKMQKNEAVSEKEISEFIAINPEYYDAYRIAGDYLRDAGNYSRAIALYNKALTREIATLNERRSIESSVDLCDKKMKND